MGEYILYVDEKLHGYHIGNFTNTDKIWLTGHNRKDIQQRKVNKHMYI